MADVERSTGIETGKVLAKAVTHPGFTVNSLAEAAGVHRTTVDTVLRRYSDVFVRLPTPSVNGRKGRPPATWQVRYDKLDEVVDLVRKAEIPPIPWSPDDDPQDVEADLILAAGSLRRARVDDPEELDGHIAAARMSLRASGLLGAEATPDAPPPVAHAALLARTADVLEAWAHGDAKRLDIAQAEALACARQVAHRITADRWLPLVERVVEAPGTVLTAPVVVERSDTAAVRRLFPQLRLLRGRGRSPPGYVYLVDKRATPPSSDPVAQVVFPDDDPSTRTRIADVVKQAPGDAKIIVVSAKPSVLQRAAAHGAYPLRNGAARPTRQAVAQLVNQLAVGIPAFGLGAGR